MEQGPTESKILENCYRFNQPIPEKIRNAPTLWLGLELYYTGFFMLTASRPVGMGVGAISWSVISDYCLVNEIEGEQRDDFIFLINAMDAEYLKHVTKNKGKPTGGKDGTRAG